MFSGVGGGDIEVQKIGSLQDIGVIIPFYGSKHKLFRTLESAAKQTLAPDMVVLIDDCGPDPLTKEDELQWHERIPQLVYLYNEYNLGAGLTRNVGMDYLEGKVRYLHFLDSDDCVSENFYEEMLRGLEFHPKCVAGYSQTENVGKGYRDVRMDATSLYDGFFKPRPWATCSLLWRASEVSTVRWSNMSSSEDTLFELKVAGLNENVFPVDKTSVRVYQDFDSDTNKERNKPSNHSQQLNQINLYTHSLNKIPWEIWRRFNDVKYFLRMILDKNLQLEFKKACQSNDLRNSRKILGYSLLFLLNLLERRVSS